MNTKKELQIKRPHVDVAFLNRLLDMDLKATKSSNSVILTKYDGTDFTKKEIKNIHKTLIDNSEYF